MVSNSPWMRVKNPQAIPEDVTSQWLINLSNEEFASLLRDNLLPMEPTGPKRAAWNGYWELIQTEHRLTSRAEKVLSRFLSAVEAALETGNLPEAEHRRAVKFQVHVENSWERLAPSNLPSIRKRFGPNARVIMGLVEAIVEHREELEHTGSLRPEDEILWQVISRLRLESVARLV